ncbi:MAG: ABC transporter permease [Gemmataceae bacterium]|nr:ABC transporter permease [Gemmataceae bacterium]
MTPCTPSDVRFFGALGLLGGLYVLLVAALIAADLSHTSPGAIARVFESREIRSAVWLSLLSASTAAILAVWVAVPLGYLLARTHFPGRALVELLVDVPIVLPPTVVGLSLLVLFQTAPGAWVERHAVSVTYAVAGVVLAQFTVSAAFATRTVRVVFEQIDPRAEAIARTLGCSRAQAFWLVTLPEAWRGVLAAFTLAWARAVGEFGPVLVFCGATRMRTEVLPTSVFLELSAGNLDAALAVSLVMIGVAGVVLVLMRAAGLRSQ